MSDSIRAFVSVELDATARSTLEKLADEIACADVPGVRLVRPEAVHLTLKFLGEVAYDRVDSVVVAVADIAHTHSTFTLRLGGLSAFPSPASPSVLWVRLDGDLAPLSMLQREIEDSLVAIGFPRERRAFSPHLTVARVGDRTSRADRSRVTQLLVSTQVETGIVIKHRLGQSYA